MIDNEGIRPSDIERLESAQVETTHEIKELTSAISELVLSQKLQMKDNETVRDEQAKINKKAGEDKAEFDSFVETFNEEYKPVINRSKWVQDVASDVVKKYLTPALIIAILAAAGYNFIPG